VAFTFGLLHGLGFAGALAEVGLPPLSIPIALLFFNIGVEIGQLLCITAMFAAIALARWFVRGMRMPRPAWLWWFPPYVIGGVASYWVFARVAAF
ncbi:MAG: HupE/UreJ family protein, partial [Gammaproteobacteria bacterium]|nr:HupE/UreJ family protein [Gammaproteobacteria bacterium]